MEVAQNDEPVSSWAICIIVLFIVAVAIALWQRDSMSFSLPVRIQNGKCATVLDAERTARRYENEHPEIVIVSWKSTGMPCVTQVEIIIKPAFIPKLDFPVKNPKDKNEPMDSLPQQKAGIIF